MVWSLCCHWKLTVPEAVAEPPIIAGTTSFKQTVGVGVVIVPTVVIALVMTVILVDALLQLATPVEAVTVMMSPLPMVIR